MDSVYLIFLFILYILGVIFSCVKIRNYNKQLEKNQGRASYLRSNLKLLDFEFSYALSELIIYIGEYNEPSFNSRLESFLKLRDLCESKCFYSWLNLLFLDTKIKELKLDIFPKEEFYVKQLSPEEVYRLFDKNVLDEVEKTGGYVYKSSVSLNSFY